MTDFPPRLQFSSRHFPGSEQAYGKTYQRLLDRGHDLRKNAGLFLAAMDDAATQEKITKPHVDAILKAAHEETMPTGLPLVELLPEFQTFYYEFAHRFDDEAKAALKKAFPDLDDPVRMEGKYKLRYDAEVNGWFHELTAGGKVTEAEVAKLIGVRSHHSFAHFKNALVTLVHDSDVEFEGTSLLDLRAGIQDGDNLQNQSILRIVGDTFAGEEPVDAKGVRKMVADIEDAFATKNFDRNQFVRFFDWARRTHKMPAQVNLNLTDDGKTELNEWTKGTPAVTRIMKSLPKKPKTAKMEELGRALIWAYGTRIQNNGGHRTKVENILGKPYYVAYENEPETRAIFDELFHGAQLIEKREMIDKCDLFGLLDLGRLWSSNVRHQEALPRKRKKLDVCLQYGQLQIDTYFPKHTLVFDVGDNGKMKKMDKNREYTDCTAAEVKAIIADENLLRIVRRAMHSSIQY